MGQRAWGRKVGFCSGIHRYYRRGALPEEVSNHLIEMTSIKGNSQKKIIYTQSQRSIQFIQYNKKNYQILNQIYNIIAEFQAQDKKITICKVSAHMGFKRN